MSFRCYLYICYRTCIKKKKKLTVADRHVIPWFVVPWHQCISGTWGSMAALRTRELRNWAVGPRTSTKGGASCRVAATPPLGVWLEAWEVPTQHAEIQSEFGCRINYVRIGVLHLYLVCYYDILLALTVFSLWTTNFPWWTQQTCCQKHKLGTAPRHWKAQCWLKRTGWDP